MSDITKIESQSDLEWLLNDNERVVLKFTAPSWCAPCRALAPHYAKAAEASHDVVFASVDIDEHPEIALEYSVMAVPTVALFENGERVRDLRGRTAVKLISELLINELKE